MSKSIMIIETPKNCHHCKFEDWDEEEWCYKCKLLDLPTESKTYHNGQVGFVRKLLCPFKKLPEKRLLPKEMVEWTNYGEEPWFSDGWNACIDEILGEEDD